MRGTTGELWWRIWREPPEFRRGSGARVASWTVEEGVMFVAEVGWTWGAAEEVGTAWYGGAAEVAAGWYWEYPYPW